MTEGRRNVLLHLVGLALSIGLAWGGWWLWENWGQVARIDQWTGVEALRPWRPWLTQLKSVILFAGGALVLSLISWLVQRLRLGN